MEGKRDIQRWLITHTNQKQQQHFLDTAWLIEDAEMNASRARKSCMEVLQEALSSEGNLHLKTHKPCEKQWFSAALGVFSKNSIVGPESCAKPFMVMLLSIMFDCFFWPSNSRINGAFVNAAMPKNVYASDKKWTALQPYLQFWINALFG